MCNLYRDLTKEIFNLGAMQVSFRVGASAAGSSPGEAMCNLHAQQSRNAPVVGA